MFPATLDALPDDVLYDVLYHSPVRDILALRQVSRKFYHLTHHRPIWANAYTRCPILLPPGPFSYQSAVDLERTLKKSHLLEANWTSPYPRPVSRQTFVFTLDPRFNVMKLVARYLLVAGRPRLRCYDLESKDELTPIAAYDSIETDFDCVVEKYSAVDSIDCRLLCALRSGSRQGGIGVVTLLRLHISQDSAEFELVKEVQVPEKPFHTDVQITADFLAMGNTYHGPMLLHIPTFHVYDVPPCDFLDNVDIDVRIGYAVTSNHLFCYSFLGSETILEVFPVPRRPAQQNGDDETPVHILTRSHKCIINQSIGPAILLTERYYLHNSNDHRAHYTYVFFSSAGMWGRFGFLDISLVSDCVTATWTDAEFEGEDNILVFRGSARAGVSRLVALTPHNEAIAFTVSEDGNGKRVVRGNPIVVDDELTKLRMTWDAFDSIQGRICRAVSSGHIQL